MLKTKKSDMSIALIVSAVIALIIIVVALAILGKGTGDSANALRSCLSRGGYCSDIKCPKEEAEIPNVECEAGKPHCCLKV